MFVVMDTFIEFSISKSNPVSTILLDYSCIGYKTCSFLGGVLVDSPSECTVLVTNKVYRTCKFLSAMGSGTPIVSEAWISECAKQRRYVDPNAFILQDAVSEKRYKFSLSQSLKVSRDTPIFANMSFFITPSTKPLPQELHSEFLE